MNRRQFLVPVAGGLLAASFRLAAQPAPGIRRIGYLTPAHRSADRDSIQGWLDQLASGLRLPKGQKVEFVLRTADGDAARLLPLASELVDAKVDAIVAAGPPAIRAASQATRSIPIVMAYWGGEGLLESGIIKSFARPGTNVTGIYMLAAELDAKRLELLLQALPRARRIAVLAPASDWKEVPGAMRNIAQAAGIDLRMTAVPGADGYDRVFEAMVKDRVDALVVPSSPRFGIESEAIVAAAAAHRMPAIYESGDFARSGGLVGYGPVFVQLNRAVVRYLQQILAGRNPAEMAVEQPAKFELVVNLRTARSLGLTLPQSLLVRADEVVQ